MRALALAVGLSVLLPLTAAAQTRTWTSEQQEVWQAVERLALAFNRGDMKTVYEGVHPDFVFWNSDNAVPGDRDTAQTLDTAFWGVVDARMHGTTVTPVTITVIGDVAAVHAYVRGYRAIGEGEPQFSAVRWTSVWKKEDDGRWLQILNYADPDGQ